MSSIKTIGSLFAGIGGIELGLEQALGAKTIWQVECNPYALKVLEKHWPDATRYNDIRTVGANLQPVDLICGGFPCQDLSHANTRGRSGLSGGKSGLWSEFRRVIATMGATVIVVENIFDGWRKWVPIVRRDLYKLGYSSVPFRVCASDVGAPHRRRRIFVVAHANSESQSTSSFNAQMARMPSPTRSYWPYGGQPPSETMGVADGVPAKMDRLRCVGNSVSPQVSAYIGQLIQKFYNTP